MIALVDCNNFYASCERVLRPDLMHQPVVVLSNNDGCIIARSAEAKAMGIAMGVPYFKIKRELKEKKVAVFSSNYTLYGDMSARVAECMDHFSDTVEIYSVDEAFAKFQFADNQLEERAARMRQLILQWVGIPVKVGIAKSKTLAKIAATEAKKRKTGVFIISSETQRENLLKATALHKVWGAGRGYQRLLSGHGINTAWDFAQLPNHFIQKHMGVVGLRMAHELRGTSCISVKTRVKKRKMILTSRSFSHPVTEYKEMKEAVSAYVHECSNKLRSEKLLAGEIAISIETFRHRKEEPQNNAKASYILPSATDSIITLNKVALDLLRHVYKDNHKYKKAGITLLRLTPKEQIQNELFHEMQSQCNQKLMQTIDSLNKKHGTNTIRLLSEGIEQEWKMSSQFRSKRATTRWDELVEI